jgi:hypothetical protein
MCGQQVEHMLAGVLRTNSIGTSWYTLQRLWGLRTDGLVNWGQVTAGLAAAGREVCECVRKLLVEGLSRVWRKGREVVSDFCGRIGRTVGMVN